MGRRGTRTRTRTDRLAAAVAGFASSGVGRRVALRRQVDRIKQQPARLDRPQPTPPTRGDDGTDQWRYWDAQGGTG